MSTSLVFGVLITIGIIALLAVAGLLSSGGRATASQEPEVRERTVSREESRVNGARHLPQEQAAAPGYPRLSSSREPYLGTVQRGQAEERQEDLQARYEKTLQELMTMLQQEQRPPSATISLEEGSDPYRVRPRRQIDDAVADQERSMVASQTVPEPEQPAVVQTHYSLVPNDEEARKKLPSGLSIPVSIELDGSVELERVPRMRIEVIIHIQ